MREQCRSTSVFQQVRSGQTRLNCHDCWVIRRGKAPSIPPDLQHLAWSQNFHIKCCDRTGLFSFPQCCCRLAANDHAKHSKTELSYSQAELMATRTYNSPVTVARSYRPTHVLPMNVKFRKQHLAIPTRKSSFITPCCQCPCPVCLNKTTARRCTQN